MPKEVRSEDRRVMVSIRQYYLTEAGKCGVAGIEEYIEFLKNAVYVLQIEIKKTEDEKTNDEAVKFLLNTSGVDKNDKNTT